MFLAFLALFMAHSRGQLPQRSLGMYILLADETIQGYRTSDNWQPSLFPYQQKGANVLFFSFIHPTQMTVPKAFINLAKCRGSPGCPTANQKIIFSVGGDTYSRSPNPWPFLASRSAAEAMAATVAKWDTLYGADGIDLDIEKGAGDAPGVGNFIVAFSQRLKQLNPKFLITVPVFGWPQVAATDALVNNGWNQNSQSTGITDSIGLMLYTGLDALKWVKSYAQATSQQAGWRIHVNVPTKNIMVGIGGTESSSIILQMADAVNQQNLAGMMVWMASVFDKTRNKNAYTYSSGDASGSKLPAWEQALIKMGGPAPPTQQVPSPPPVTTSRQPTSSSSSLQVRVKAGSTGWWVAIFFETSPGNYVSVSSAKLRGAKESTWTVGQRTPWGNWEFSKTAWPPYALPLSVVFQSSGVWYSACGKLNSFAGDTTSGVAVGIDCPIIQRNQVGGGQHGGNSSNTKKDSNGLPLAVVIAIIGACVVVVVTIAIFLYRRMKLKKAMENDSYKVTLLGDYQAPAPIVE